LANRLPDWGRKLLIRSGTALHVEEKSWNAFPYIKTIYTCPLFDEEKFEVVVESRHAEDAGTTENIHNLSPIQLKRRVVDQIDIVTDKVEQRYYKKEEDPSFFKSKKTGRGLLKKGWQNSSKPVSCAYKLVTVNFSYWGLRYKVEKLLQDVIRNVYLTTHRQGFAWIDEWYDLSFDQVRAVEAQFKNDLNKMSASVEKKQGETKSTTESAIQLKSKL